MYMFTMLKLKFIPLESGGASCQPATMSPNGPAIRGRGVVGVGQLRPGFVCYMSRCHGSLLSMNRYHNADVLQYDG